MPNPPTRYGTCFDPAERNMPNDQLCAELTIMLHRASAAPIGGYTRGRNALVDHAQ